eukprot:2264894-Alexandrium_andersonii.AAC.1
MLASRTCGSELEVASRSLPGRQPPESPAICASSGLSVSCFLAQKKTKVPTQTCHVAHGALGALGICKIASGVQSLNCADPGKTSTFVPEAPE